MYIIFLLIILLPFYSFAQSHDKKLELTPEQIEKVLLYSVSQQLEGQINNDLNEQIKTDFIKLFGHAYPEIPKPNDKLNKIN